MEEIINYHVVAFRIIETKTDGNGEWKIIYWGYELRWLDLEEVERGVERERPNRLKDIVKKEYTNEQILNVKMKFFEQK